jgi:asparagine N-glycosylation enzyme membrane subunit Stt3
MACPAREDSSRPLPACYAAGVNERKRWAHAETAFVGLIFAAALAVRLLSLSAATAGGLRLLSPDCYGHLRRAASVARNFPRVPVFDPYLNHPDGGIWIWPPAFDVLVGGLARVIYGPGATIGEVARVAAATPPFLGALGVVPLFLFARRAFGRRRALLSIAAYALLPAAAIWSQFGHADQHVAEVLGLLLFLASGARAAARKGPARTVAALGAGAALAVLLLTWQGAVASAAIGLLWSALFLGPAAAALALAAASLTALGAAVTLREGAVPFTFVSFGWFQPYFVAALTVPVTLLAAFRSKTRSARWGLTLTAVAIGVVVAPRASDLLVAAGRGGAYVAVRNLPTGTGGNEFASGGYLFYPAEIVSGVFESRPLLAGPATGAVSRAVVELSAGVLLLPFVLVLWSVPFLRGSGPAAAPRRAARALAVFFGAAFLVFTLLQRRNIYYLAIFAALALGDVVARLAARAGRRAGGTLRRRASGVLTTGVSIALVGALEILPGAPAYARLQAYAEAPGRDLLDLLGRLRALDPPGIDPAAVPPPRPGAIPGVMAPWSLGHFVTAVAERPAAADPFFYGWRRQARLFTTTDDAEARDILLGARCRYLVTTDLRPVLSRYAEAAGRKPVPPETTFVVRVHESAEERPVPFLVRVLDSRTASRAPDGRVVPRFRIFRVDGAP